MLSPETERRQEVQEGIGKRIRPRQAYNTEAGTQALPVDTTNAESPNGRAADFESGSVGSTPASAPKFDKRAWMREYMREHRRGILRRPKPSIQTTTEERNDK